MATRWAKILLLLAVALFYSVVVFNNLTDYVSNYEFVHHVLLMDSTFAANHGKWRAIHLAWMYHAFYASIIAWEGATTILCWWGSARLIRSIAQPFATFNQAKRPAVIALTMGLLMWFVAFLTVGGEWFLMWQSKIWNGQEAAFRMFTVIGVVLIFLTRPDTESQA